MKADDDELFIPEGKALKAIESADIKPGDRVVVEQLLKDPDAIVPSDAPASIVGRKARVLRVSANKRTARIQIEQVGSIHTLVAAGLRAISEDDKP
ncbi:hypothetical protein [Herbidospora daliensis]|uniref:hypothetical protein n=1 Tax=Herbidospora daliensis TaxID=295585 RepID=UPI0007832435|nr:hypothetical protein [Herbidospora daliensis]